MPPPIEAPANRPYPGAISLQVDLTDTVHRVEKVHEQIPVVPGAREVVLLYPQWIPGTHEPAGSISAVAGLVTKVDGAPVQWLRDQVEVYAFHVPLPSGAKSVQVEFDYLSPIKPSAGRVEISDAIEDLAWNEVLLYPAGHFARDIQFEPKLALPTGWKYATALETASTTGETIQFEPTPLNTLVDSPLYAGKYFDRIDLSPTATDIVRLNVVADRAEDLKTTPEMIDMFKRLALEADKLYGSHHYKHYDFLLLLSDKVGGIGLEHHQSSEDGWPARFFVDWKKGVLERDLLAHEYTHSWNGKFRRPADLWTPNFNVPMRDDLLWVYEGMTQYWGNVLTARAGLRTPEQTRAVFARVAAIFAASPGRDWRPLVDTTNQPTMSQRRAVSWSSFQRPEDYYTEGELIWLDADTKIRELTHDQKSLDDFCKVFLAVYNGSFVTDQYTLDDVVNGLNEVVPYDWKGFLESRVYRLHPEVPINGFTQGGYKLVYSDTEPGWMNDVDAGGNVFDGVTSIGFTIGNRRAATPSATVSNVLWGSAAFQAGIRPDMELLAVNKVAYTLRGLKDAIVDAQKTHTPVELEFKDGKEYRTFSVPYFGGLRFPTLQRLEGTPARLDHILDPSKSPLPAM